jgi:hypothetical protein
MRPLLAGLVMGLVACGAAVPPPTDQFAAAQMNLGRAQESGAADVPDAKLHLQLAQESLLKAKELMDRDNERATTLVTRASAEADFALSLTRQARAKEAADRANDALKKAKGGGS